VSEHFLRSCPHDANLHVVAVPASAFSGHEGALVGHLIRNPERRVTLGGGLRATVRTLLTVLKIAVSRMLREVGSKGV
jgi:hypothetical protein